MGKKVGELNRYYKKYECNVNIPFNGKLDLIVENMGELITGLRLIRIQRNYFPVFINDRKITGDWEMYGLPFEKAPVIDAKQKSDVKENRPVIYKGNFNVSQVGDTFLDMRLSEKGLYLSMELIWEDIGR